MADQPPPVNNASFSAVKNPDDTSKPSTSTRQLSLLQYRLEQYPSSSKRRNPDVFCEHCDRYVSEKTRKKHKSLFPYQSDSNVDRIWMSTDSDAEWQNDLCAPG